MADITYAVPPADLAEHDLRSQARYEGLVGNINDINKGKDMTAADGLNLFTSPNTGSGMGGAAGGGFAGALVGGLLTRGGVLGGGTDGGVPLLNSINSNTDNAVAAAERLTTARFDAQAQLEILAAVERTAAATQIASAAQSAAIGIETVKGFGETNTQVALTTGNLNTQAALNAAALGVQVQKIGGDLGVQVALNTAAVATAVNAGAAATALAFKDAALLNSALASGTNERVATSQFVTTQAIQADGERTRALIIAQNDATLNRLLTTAQNEIIELRGDREGTRRSRETEINVTQNVNQATAVAQQQQQSQYQSNLLSQLVHQFSSLQNAVSTNSQIILGNTGAVVAGPQSANPTNVRA